MTSSYYYVVVLVKADVWLLYYTYALLPKHKNKIRYTQMIFSKYNPSEIFKKLKYFRYKGAGYL